MRKGLIAHKDLIEGRIKVANIENGQILSDEVQALIDCIAEAPRTWLPQMLEDFIYKGCSCKRV